MKLPNADQAVITPAKLRDYLLNEAHPENQGKARLFEALGYTPADWQRLAADLRAQHLSQDAEEGLPSAFGDTWRIDARLTGPGGSAMIASIWIVETHGDGIPKFVTAYQANR